MKLYLMQLHLFSVTRKKIDARTQVNFIWSFFIWMTSMHNVYIVTKRNMASATFGMCFLMMSIDKFNAHHNTSEASDNTFGLFRGMKRGFYIMECVEIEEKISRKRAEMYE